MQQHPFISSLDALLLLRLVRAQALRELGRHAEAVAELESVAAQGSEALLPLYSLLACVAMCCLHREDASLCADALVLPGPPHTRLPAAR